MIKLPHGASSTTVRKDLPADWDYDNLSAVTIGIKTDTGTEVLAATSTTIKDSTTVNGATIVGASSVILSADMSLKPGDRLLISSSAPADEVFTAEESVTTGAIALSLASSTAGRRIRGVTVNFNSAPVSAGSLTFTLNSAAGAAYDCLLWTASMVGETEYYKNGGDVSPKGWAIASGDSFDIAYANPDNRTVSIVCYYTEGA